MKIRALETGIMSRSLSGILCLALAACSHEGVTTSTEPAKTESAATVPEVEKTEPSKPLATEPVAVREPAENAKPNKIAVLKPGQSTSLDASTILHYVRLVSDSRCPVNAQCIWAGEATIELTLESGKEKQTFTLSDRANTKEAMGFEIELVSIDRSHLVEIRFRKL